MRGLHDNESRGHVKGRLARTHPDHEEHGVGARPLQDARRNNAAIEPATTRDHQVQVHHEIDDDVHVLQ